MDMIERIGWIVVLFNVAWMVYGIGYRRGVKRVRDEEPHSVASLRKMPCGGTSLMTGNPIDWRIVVRNAAGKQVSASEGTGLSVLPDPDASIRARPVPDWFGGMVEAGKDKEASDYFGK